MSQTDFVDALVHDLRPVRTIAPWPRVVLLWCGLSGSLIGAVILTVGPLRLGIVSEFLTSPRLVVEIAIAIMAGLTAIAAGLELGVPGSPAPGRLWRAPFLLFAAWILVILFELVSPSGSEGETSNAMRVHCFLQTVLVSVPSAALALYLLHGRILFRTGGAGWLCGAAATALPALWMELSCMSAPIHALQFHLSPILLIGAGVALLTKGLIARG